MVICGRRSALKYRQTLFIMGAMTKHNTFPCEKFVQAVSKLQKEYAIPPKLLEKKVMLLPDKTLRSLSRNTIGNLFARKRARDDTIEVVTQILMNELTFLGWPGARRLCVAYLMEGKTPCVRIFSSSFGADAVHAMLAEVNLIIRTPPRKTIGARILGIAMDGAKGVFWKKINALAELLGMSPARFSEIVGRAGMPPELPFKDKRANTLEYARRILADPSTLTHDQRTVWSIATLVYPPGGKETDLELKNAARYMAKYFDRSIRFAREQVGVSIAPILGERRPQEATLVFLLSWLELPLVTQTGNVEPGKIGLFELGCWYQRHHRFSMTEQMRQE